MVENLKLTKSKIMKTKHMKDYVQLTNNFFVQPTKI